MTPHRLLANLAAWAAGLAMVLPLAWVAAGSLDASADALQNPLTARPTLAHYRTLFTDHPMARWLANAALLAAAPAVLGTLAASLAGYALAQRRLPHRGVLTAVLLATLLVPYHALLAPSFELIVRLGLFDTYAAVLLPASASAAGVLLYRQVMGRLDPDLLDAARLDGAGEWRVWWQVAMPAARPATAALTLMLFLAGWNGFLWPAAVLHTEAKHPLSVALATLQVTPAFQLTPGLLMAALTLGVLPPILLFGTVHRDLDRVL